MKLQKKIIKAFKLLEFKIEIASNLKIINLLDITLNLNNNTAKPYHKEYEIPKYINVDSSHPYVIMKYILITVGPRIIKRLSSINV